MTVELRVDEVVGKGKEHYFYTTVPIVDLHQPLCQNKEEVILWTKIRRDAGSRYRYSNVTLLVVYCMASVFLLLFYYLTSVSSVSFRAMSNYQPLPYRSPMDCNHYKDALSKNFLYFEAQRSGKLPESQRVKWRGDSGLNDGRSNNVDLSGGYHDAGDNVKFGLPMAYTITIMAWSILEHGRFMEKAEELQHAEDAVRWGTDYLLKTYPRPNELWAQVGDANADHRCWVRPEDMQTPRTAYKVDKDNPGSDIAGETAAALAASSIVFQKTDPEYANRLLEASKQIFKFADTYRGKYSDAIKGACPFYCSFSGYKDELLWGATWLYKATLDGKYLRYIELNSKLGGATIFRPVMDWDNKYAGVQVLLSQIYLSNPRIAHFKQYKDRADELVCATLPGLSSSRLRLTPGGIIHRKPGSNLQFATSSAFLFTVYSNYLRRTSSHVLCKNVAVSPRRLTEFARQQVDYILGVNPKNMSYMVGFGSNYPKQVHHRAASIPSITVQPKNMTCRDGWAYFSTSKHNPNVIVGAVVGGPDRSDKFEDLRWNFQQSEPAIYINAPLGGALASLYGENSLLCDLFKS
ncbi:unnamed protein product [Calypogeia fissa]